MDNQSTNTAVALIFFNRADTFKMVFEAVRKAKPRELFLIQDGAREGNSADPAGIKACREVAENVDWVCNVHKNYADTNLGCGIRPSSGISWVFEHVDRAIILEDDCVPCESFFAYCEELLERYKNDERIAYISGLNHFESWDCGKSSYLFAKTGAIWGWATWKRAWDRYDYYVKGYDDPYMRKLYSYQITNRIAAKKRLKSLEKVYQSIRSHEKLSYWDFQWGFVKYTQNQLVIVPKQNQICNVGVGTASTHAQMVTSTQYRKYKSFNFIPTADLKFPLVHPNYCLCDEEYDRMVYACTNNPVTYYLQEFLSVIRFDKEK